MAATETSSGIRRPRGGQLVRSVDGCRVRSADDGGNVVVLQNIGKMRPDVGVGAGVHNDLVGVERKMLLQHQPLKAAEADQVFSGRQIFVQIEEASVPELPEVGGQGGTPPRRSRSGC